MRPTTMDAGNGRADQQGGPEGRSLGGAGGVGEALEAEVRDRGEETREVRPREDAADEEREFAVAPASGSERAGEPEGRLLRLLRGRGLGVRIFVERPIVVGVCGLVRLVRNGGVEGRGVGEPKEGLDETDVLRQLRDELEEERIISLFLVKVDEPGDEAEEVEVVRESLAGGCENVEKF
jgi:hypothetical protein